MQDTSNPLARYDNDRPPAERPAGDAFGIDAPRRGLGPLLLSGHKGLTPQQRRRYFLKLSAVICILVPTFIAALYYFLIAADQYAAEARFSVRGPNAATPTDLVGAVTGVPAAGSTATDSYIVMDFIHSREILDKLAADIDIRKIYNHPDADMLARAGTGLTIEEFVDYWQSMVAVNYDVTSQIITLEVRAFSAQDAQTIAAQIVKLSETLVNELSERARNDAVRAAQKEVARMEERLRKNRGDLRKFRSVQEVVDVKKTAEARELLLGELKKQLSVTKSRLATIRPDMAANAPRVIFLQRQIAALERQIKEEEAKTAAKPTVTSTGRSKKSLSGLLSDYEELVVEQEFAVKAYTSALTSLELARAEASRQQRYLSTFVTPKIPQEAIYPQRVTNIAIVLVLSALFWVFGVLTVYAIRDHSG